MLVNAFHPNCPNCHLGLIHTLGLIKRHVGDILRQRHVSGHRAIVLQRQIGQCRDMLSNMSSISFSMSCVLSFGASRRHVFRMHCQLRETIEWRSRLFTDGFFSLVGHLVSNLHICPTDSYAAGFRLSSII